VNFPSPAFERIEVEAGQVKALQGVDAHGRRHVLIVAGLRPYPWRVLASRSKKAGLPFHTWQTSTRDQVRAALRTADIEPFPSDAVLGLAMAFGAARWRDPKGGRAVSVLEWDLRNLEKALEDVMTGTLWHDDAQVRYSGPGSARDDGADWWSLHAWDGDCGFDPAWAGASVPVVEAVR
jgi:hypothetical protein